MTPIIIHETKAPGWHAALARRKEEDAADRAPPPLPKKRIWIWVRLHRTHARSIAACDIQKF